MTKFVLKVLITIMFLVGAGYGGVKIYIHNSVKEFLDQTARATSGVLNISYGRIRSSLGGRIGVDDIRVRPQDVDDEIRIASVELNAPNLKYLLDAKQEFAKNSFPRSMSVSITGLQLDIDGGLMSLANSVSRDLNRAYGITENDPCKSPDLLHFMYYSTAGYKTIKMDMQLGYEWNKVANSIRIRASSEDDDSNRIETDSVVTLPSPEQLLQLERYSPHLVSHQIVVHEKGLIGKLSSYCAKKLGVDVATFVSKKADAQEQQFAKSWGIIPGDGLRAAYEQALLSGLPVTVRMIPNRPTNPEEFDFYSPADLVQLLNLEVLVGTQKVQDLAFRFPEFTPTRSFGEQFIAQMPEFRSYTEAFVGDSDDETINSVQQQPQSGPVKREYKVVRTIELPKHVGKDVRILTSDGQIRQGWLQNSGKTEITVSWRVGGGEMSAVIPFERIKNAEVLLEVSS